MSSSAPDASQPFDSGMPGVGAVPSASQPFDSGMPGVGAVPSAPPVPPGPGVTPPFPAPPTEGRSTRLWLALGTAGVAVALCCGGGLVAGVGLFITGTEAVNERAQSVVGGYLDDVRDGRYHEAYDVLCPRLRSEESEREFVRRIASEPRVTSYNLDEARLSTEVSLRAEVRYSDGGSDSLRFVLEQDSSTGEFEVCGIDG